MLYELGRKAGLVYPDGSKVYYGYDQRGRLVKIDDSGRGQALATYSYDPLGRIAQLARDNGVATRYQYDMAGQLTNIAHTLGGTTLASSHYELDVNGRRIEQTREDNLPERYSYDATSQLTGVIYGNGNSEGFAYDSVGNRTQASEIANAKAQSTTYSANNLNQYTALRTSGSSNPVSFIYDLNGNLLTDGRYDYQYDSQNRLISVGSVSSVVQTQAVRAEFFYDAKNRCVLRRYYTKNTQGQWVQNTTDSRALSYDANWNLLAERTLDGKQAGEYIFGSRTDEILSARLGSKTYYPLADGLGSTVALTDKNGLVIERYRSTAYGMPTVLKANYQPQTVASATGYRFLFTGREWLAQVGLNDHRNRYYSPRLGRWTATDPIGFLGGKNLYAYVANECLNASDAIGLSGGHSGCCGGVVGGGPGWQCCGNTTWYQPSNSCCDGNTVGPKQPFYQAAGVSEVECVNSVSIVDITDPTAVTVSGVVSVGVGLIKKTISGVALGPVLGTGVGLGLVANTLAAQALCNMAVCPGSLQ